MGKRTYDDSILMEKHKSKESKDSLEKIVSRLSLANNPDASAGINQKIKNLIIKELKEFIKNIEFKPEDFDHDVVEYEFASSLLREKIDKYLMNYLYEEDK